MFGVIRVSVLLAIAVALVREWESRRASPGIQRDHARHLPRRPITSKDAYQSHVYNGTSIALNVDVTCYPGGDAHPVTSTSRLYPPLQPGYGEDAYVKAGCRLIRVNESHQLW